MWKIYLQKFSGSINIKNYQGQEDMGKFWTLDEARDELNALLRKADRAGFDVLDSSYFSKDYSQGFSLVIATEDETATLHNPFVQFALTKKKGGTAHARQ